MKAARGLAPAKATAIKAKDEAILVLLAKLALHYWRPDFLPSQAKQLYADYCEDLREFPLSEIASAIKKYRRDTTRRFYPSSGELIGIIRAHPPFETQRERDMELRLSAERELVSVSSHIGGQRLISALG